ncbi:MAG: rod shape-determining protein MreC [Eubacteriales bacterium]
MAKKKGIIKNRPALITVIVIFTLIALMVMTSGEQNMSGGESIIGSLLMPVQGGIYSVTDTVGNFFERVFAPSDLREENKVLREEIAQYKNDLNTLEELKKENERLKELLVFKDENTEFVMVTAKVTGIDSSNYFSIFTINRGVLDGVAIDMPVITEDGLVGRIIETGATWSKVMSIIDYDSGVSAIVELTRDNGVVQGTTLSNTDEPLLEMAYLPFDADILPGYRVITSGLGGVYPKGLIIGDTVEITRTSDNSQETAYINPAVDFLHLEEVMIITEFESTEADIDLAEELAPSPSPSQSSNDTIVVGE